MNRRHKDFRSALRSACLHDSVIAPRTRVSRRVAKRSPRLRQLGEPENGTAHAENGRVFKPKVGRRSGVDGCGRPCRLPLKPGPSSDTAAESRKLTFHQEGLVVHEVGVEPVSPRKFPVIAENTG